MFTLALWIETAQSRSGVNVKPTTINGSEKLRIGEQHNFGRSIQNDLGVHLHLTQIDLVQFKALE